MTCLCTCPCAGDLVRASTGWLWAYVPVLGGCVVRSFAPCRLILEKTVPGPRPDTIIERFFQACGAQKSPCGETVVHKQTVGMIYFHPDKGQVQWLAVAQQHRKEGLGALLMAAAIEVRSMHMRPSVFPSWQATPWMIGY
jgi:ribosomal protein S18 acetylase RimI-like enzyme